MSTQSPQTVTIAGLKFILATNTVRSIRLRTVILNEYLTYFNTFPFASDQERREFAVTHDPYYVDIFSATIAIEGDEKDKMLSLFKDTVANWDAYLLEHETEDTDVELMQATRTARTLNPRWYTSFAPPASEAQEMLDQAIAAADPQNDEVTERPSIEQAYDAVDEVVARVTAEREAENKAFLAPKSSSKSQRTAKTVRAVTKR